MKREIKFKFWLGHTKKMTYEHSLVEISHLFWDFTEDIIPLQFTGLKDKNGKDIYEGDILQIDHLRYKVIYDDTSASFLGLDKYGEDHTTISIEIDLEVIGNIHEHPNLLNP